MLIHMGLITHHHDQSITLHSFSTTKAIVNKPAKPTPPDEDFESLIFILIQSSVASQSRRFH